VEARAFAILLAGQPLLVVVVMSLLPDLVPSLLPGFDAWM
jgi:hypothetical protein